MNTDRKALGARKVQIASHARRPRCNNRLSGVARHVQSLNQRYQQMRLSMGSTPSSSIYMLGIYLDCYTNKNFLINSAISQPALPANATSPWNRDVERTEHFTTKGEGNF
ncbi:hypothetical protein J6590_010294 [Homalodisca vitripennis]|nr:hypothetical protein J6590_010294 [Homalodisca vitripennis]